MRLGEIANGAAGVGMADIGRHPDLVRDVQERLGALGLLDPPVDGTIGPVSRWALDAFLAKTKLKAKTGIDREVAQRLAGETADGLYPLNPRNDLAGRLLRALQARKYWITRHPECVNIVYVEGMDPDGTPNDNEPNHFNDSRFVLRINQAGRPVIEDAWEATTEPGRFWTSNPMNPGGAARIAFGQYKAWSVGIHNASKPSGHESLVQTAEITVHRDLNQDFSRAGDRTDIGLFGVNQHWGYDNPKDDIGKAGAGCLVGRTKSGHRAFMTVVKSDPRYVASHGYRFITAVLAAKEVGNG